MTIRVQHPIQWEIISRVLCTKKDAEDILNTYNIDSPFNPYVKMNSSKTGWYVCYLASWNEDRIREWYSWLKEKGLKCYLVRA